MNDKPKLKVQSDGIPSAPTTNPPSNKNTLTAIGKRNQEEEEKKRLQNLATFQSTLVSRNERISKPDYLFNIGGVPCMPLEGITAFTGEAKQGKTQLLTIMEGVLISGQTFGNIQKAYNGNPIILHIDTEQTPFDVQCNIDRLTDIAQLDPTKELTEYNLYFSRTRKYSVKERLDILDVAVKELHPQIIIVDGCRDLVEDFNDPRETLAVINKFMQYADGGASVWTILHVNPGTEKMRGHLGTELLNKCSDKWTVKKINETFQTKHVCRGREVTDTPAFRFDNNKLVPADAIQIEGEETAYQEAERIVNDIFQNTPSMSFDEYKKQFMKVSGKSLATFNKRNKELQKNYIIHYDKKEKTVTYTKPF